MIVKLFAVKDNASGVYDGPVPAQTEGIAMRNFTDMCNNPDTAIAKHPEDFSLWCVGTWNDATGEIISGQPECLARATSILSPEEIN